MKSVDSDKDKDYFNDNFSLKQVKVKQEGNRKDRSLFKLTEELIQIIKSCENQQITLKDLLNRSNNKKRRAYDIINIFKGVGFIKEEGKNVLKWVCPYSNDDEILKLQNQLKEIKTEREQLEKFQKEMFLSQKKMFNEKELQEYLYLDWDDVLTYLKDQEEEACFVFEIQSNAVVDLQQESLNGESILKIQNPDKEIEMYYCTKNQEDLRIEKIQVLE